MVIRSKLYRSVRMAVLVIVMMFWFYLVVLAQVHKQTRVKDCYERLSALYSAKELYAKRHKLSSGDRVTWRQLIQEENNRVRYRFDCLTNHPYELNPIGTVPVCTSGDERHSLDYWENDRYGAP